MSDLLKWDQDGERIYETGISNGILFPKKAVRSSTGNGTSAYEAGEAWNGLTSVDESPSGGEANDIYADNMKYLSLSSAEDYGGTINAYTYPDGFRACNGEVTANGTHGLTIGQQTRKGFGFYYKTKKGNDLLYEDYAEVHYLVYNAKCNPSDKSHSTISDSPEAEEMSWEFTTTPVKIATKDSAGKEYKATAILKIDTSSFTETVYAAELTEDAAVVDGKTYYTRSGSEGAYVYTKVDNPVTTDIATYYEATDTDSIRFERLKTVLYGKAAENSNAAVDSRLPDPDEVIAIMAGSYIPS
jgi:hypothetical protein